MNVEKRKHPRGAKGTNLSVQEIVRRVEEGRLNPKTIAWAREACMLAREATGNQALVGAGADKMQQAKVVLEKLRRERGYFDDPVDAEVMPSAACTLEGCHGLKFLGEDCDGLLIAYLSAVEALGIEAAVVAHGYESPHVHDHVLAAVYDRPRKQWILCDPSTSQGFGVVSQPVCEKIILVPGGRVLCDSKNGPCDPKRLAAKGAVRENLRAQGDFVGVSRPSSGAVGEAEHETKAVAVMGDVTEAFEAVMIREIKEVLTALALQYEAMIDRHAELEAYSRITGDPFVSATDPSVEPAKGAWTEQDERDYQQVVEEVPIVLEYLYEASEKRRKIAWDEDNQQVVVLGAPGEPALVLREDGSAALVTTTGVHTGAVGQAVLIVAGAAAIIVVALAYAWIITQACDAHRDFMRARLVTKMDEVDAKLLAQGVPPEEVRKRRRELTEQVQSLTPPPARSDTTEDVMSTARLGLYAAMVLGAGYVLVQAIGAFKPAARAA